MKKLFCFLLIVFLLILNKNYIKTAIRQIFEPNDNNPTISENSLLKLDKQSQEVIIEGISLVKIKAGSFKMGSSSLQSDAKDDEKPLHEVHISKSFYMGKFEITQKQYRDTMGNNGSRFRGPNLPVEQVNWLSVQDFIIRLNKKVGCSAPNTPKIIDEQGLNFVPKGCFRLPTEAEWEYAARANTSTAFSTGENINSNQANFDGRHPYNGAAKTMYRERTIDVGSFKANSFGLHDMHGNVWEWCQDFYSKTYYTKSEAKDPVNRSKSAKRSYRGGSWSLQGNSLRSARRNSLNPIIHSINIGFRVVLVY